MTRRRVTHLNHCLIPSVAACKHWDSNGLGILEYCRSGHFHL